MQAVKRMMMLSVLVLVSAAGCDRSKPELDATKQQLTAMTAERDGLKTQLDAAKQQTAALQAQLTDIQTKLAAATAAAAAPAPLAEPDKALSKKGKKADQHQ